VGSTNIDILFITLIAFKFIFLFLSSLKTTAEDGQEKNSREEEEMRRRE
jgi:hypothetical protein